jgi:hypothetical protein
METLRPIGKLIGSSWGVYKKDFKKLTRILAWYLVFSAASVILSVIEVRFGTIEIAEILISLALVISTILCIPALLEYIASGQKISISEAFKKSRPRIWPFVWTGIMSGLIVFGGLSLLLIPGIYLMVCFSLSQYVVISEKKGGVQALWESARLVRGQWLAVFSRLIVYSLAVIALVAVTSWLDSAANAHGYITNIATLAISFLGPLFMLYFYQIYKDLRSINQAKDAKVPTKTRVLYSVLAVVGIIVPAALIVTVTILIANYTNSNPAGLSGLTGSNEADSKEAASLYEQYLQSAVSQQSPSTASTSTN